ncbi:MAG: ORF6N domain-containing protein [Tannerella sp.]|jgi:hypothetical protein|nr:ORF6N domain-containing protein [Tannerella sp.]
MSTIKFSDINDKILTIRGQQVILDSDVAALYGVGTKEVNQAVKNNPDKFPQGYIFEIDSREFESLRSKILTISMAKTRVQKRTYCSKPSPKKACTCLPLKSPRATQMTIVIVETFAKIRELARTVSELSETTEDFKQKSLMQKSGEIIADMLGDDLKTTDTETSIELNFAVFKF